MTANTDAPSQKAAESSGDRPGNYRVYVAGGLFNLHELATNVSLKEAVWRLSAGQFEIILPQSKEQRQLEIPNLAAHLRNTDLQQVVQADAIIVRFDGPELDTGTVVEFVVAKMLGKPTVLLRTDSRHLTSGGLDDPYNLMVKNWPRTVEVFINSLADYIEAIADTRKAHQEPESGSWMLESELGVIRAGVDAVAGRLIDALHSVKAMESPYPPELRELVYHAVRYAPGSGFDQLITEPQLKSLLQKLSQQNTL